MSSKQFLIDAASRHAVFLQRYSAGIEKEAAQKVSNALDQLISSLDQIPTSPSGSIRMQLLSNYRESLTGLQSELVNEFLELLESEEDFSSKMLGEAVNAQVQNVERSKLLSAFSNEIIDTIPGQRITIKGMLSKFKDEKSKQMNLILKDGFTLGKTNQQIAAEIRKVQPMLMRQAEAIARTGTNSISSIARYQSTVANESLLIGYEWVSTLDDRTSNVCKSRDGQVYPIADTSPKPPAHWGCRSTIISKIDPKYDLFGEVTGDRPAIGAEGRGTVSAGTTYAGWLRKQPASFQNEALGPVRAKLFRDGGLTLDKFVNTDGDSYTLDQLRSLNPIAFEKSGI